MAIYEITAEKLQPLASTNFSAARLKERDDLQRLLRHQIDVIAPDTMVIAEEFGDWQDSRRRIDLLALDRDANLVVVELKRTEDGGHIELQAIRYAAMVSTMTFEQVVDAHAAYRARIGLDGDARSAVLDFLGWTEPDEAVFAQDVRVLLVSGNFDKEITTAVMWLNQHGLDIRCVRLIAYALDSRTLVDVQQIIPLPEATEYQVRVRAKQEQERVAKAVSRDYTKFDVKFNETTYPRLAKRHAVFRAVKGLCDQGITPEQISGALPRWKPTFLWYSLDGDLDEASFKAQAALNGRSFDEARWFCADDQLIRSGGKTWAFLNQWGPSTIKVLDALTSAFPVFGLSYEVSK